MTALSDQCYTSMASLKARLGITDDSDDQQLQEAIFSGSRSVDIATDRFFWQTPSTEVRTYIPQSIYEQSIDDLVSITSLMVDRDGDGIYEETWTANVDYQLTSARGIYNNTRWGEPWPWTGFNIVGPKFIPIVWPWSHLNRIQVTGVFGWPAVPIAVQQATLIASEELFRFKDAPFGIAGFGEFAVRIQQNPVIMRLLSRYIDADKVGI